MTGMRAARVAICLAFALATCSTFTGTALGAEDTDSLLAEVLTPERAVQVAFTQNRDLQATLEELGVARAELIAGSTIRNPVADGEIRFPGDPARPFEITVHKTIMDLFQLGNRRKIEMLPTALFQEITG